MNNDVVSYCLSHSMLTSSLQTLRVDPVNLRKGSAIFDHKPHRHKDRSIILLCRICMKRPDANQYKTFYNDFHCFAHNSQSMVIFSLWHFSNHFFLLRGSFGEGRPRGPCENSLQGQSQHTMSIIKQESAHAFLFRLSEKVSLPHGPM